MEERNMIKEKNEMRKKNYFMRIDICNSYKNFAKLRKGIQTC